MPTPPIDGLLRYEGLLVPLLDASSRAFEASAEDEDSAQVERGTIYPLCLLSPRSGHSNARIDRLIELARRPDLASIAVVDRLGHRRGAYRGLLVYSWLQAMRLSYEFLPRDAFGRWDEALRAWCDALEAGLGEAPGGSIPASEGHWAVETAWSALALYVGGKVLAREAWTDLAGATFTRMVAARAPTGSLLTPASSDNPETHWYHELVLLHALASYAVQAEDRTAARAVAEAGEYHLRETQPDHATNQPWGLFGLLWNPETRVTAEAMVHTATVQQPNGLDGVSLMLVTDAVYCLRLFASPITP